MPSANRRDSDQVQLSEAGRRRLCSGTEDGGRRSVSMLRIPGVDPQADHRELPLESSEVPVPRLRDVLNTPEPEGRPVLVYRDLANRIEAVSPDRLPTRLSIKVACVALGRSFWDKRTRAKRLLRRLICEAGYASRRMQLMTLSKYLLVVHGGWNQAYPAVRTSIEAPTIALLI
jgi:hypothetical protein